MFDHVGLESFRIKALIALPLLLASQVILHRSHRGHYEVTDIWSKNSLNHLKLESCFQLVSGGCSEHSVSPHVESVLKKVNHDDNRG